MRKRVLARPPMASGIVESAPFETISRWPSSFSRSVFQKARVFGGVLYLEVQRHARRENPFGVETGVYLHQLDEAAQHKPGADEQGEGESDLRHQVRVAGAAASGAGGASSGLMQGGEEAPGGGCGRERPEQKPG